MESLTERLPRMIRFRNLLVHRYWQVELHQVYAVLRNDLEDLRLFCADISARLPG